VLYKYRGINEFTDSIIKDKSVWLAKPKTLNDPLECRVPKFSKAEKNAYAKKVMTNQMQGFAMQMVMAKDTGEFFGKSPREVRILIGKVKREKDFHKKYRIVNNFLKKVGATGFSSPTDQVDSLKKMIENVGVFSLSEDPMNMLLWSHYGSNHEVLLSGFLTLLGLS